MKEDEIIREAYREIKNREEAQDKGVVRKLPSNLRIIVFMIIAAILYGIYIKGIKLNNGLLLLGVILAIVYFGIKTESYARLLTEQECVIKLSQLLRYKQLHPLGDYHQIPPRLRIKILSNGKLLFLKSVPWKWCIGVTMFDPDTSLLKYFAAYLNPYSGDLIGMVSIDSISDLEKSDVEFIPDYKMFSEKQYYDYMGKFPKEKSA